MATSHLIRNARVPSCLLGSTAQSLSAPDSDFASVDIAITDGVVSQLVAAGSLGETASLNSTTDMRQGIVFPGFVEAHTHLDKGHIWSRTPNPDGTFPGALDNVGKDREASWTADDVRTRMDFALRTAYAHGTVAIRTHIDSVGKQIGISWPVLAEMRETWKDRITLQATPLFGIHFALDAQHMADVVEAVKRHGNGIFGAVSYMIPELDEALDILFRTAMEHGWDLDFHVDEASDPAARSLERIAMAALRHKFKGKILCGHCCSLALQGPDDEARIIKLVKEAGIAVVSLPMCNMYLQDRASERTPRWRGVTSMHELRKAGVPVMVSSDNTRDPFYAYGDLDGLEVFREATRIIQMDHPFGNWPRTITQTPADIMGLPDRGRIAVGLLADLVLFKARNWTELLARPQSDRVVLRNGQKFDRVFPDYSELDHLAGMRP